MYILSRLLLITTIWNGYLILMPTRLTVTARETNKSYETYDLV